MQAMDNGAKGWLVLTARQHHWRTAGWYDLDDLIQDGHMHYARIAQRYGHIKDPPHIMALFKRTYLNHLNDLSKKQKLRQPDIPVSSILRVDQNSTDFFEQHGNAEYDSTVLAFAPPQVRTALRVLLDPKNTKALRSLYRRRLCGTRETTNERLCRLAGLDPALFNLHAALKNYLTAAV